MTKYDFLIGKRCVINSQCEGRIDPSHLTTRKRGGSDEPNNVVPKCRKHHIEWHQYGISKFIKQYPQFKQVLLDLKRQDILNKLNRLSNN